VLDSSGISKKYREQGQFSSEKIRICLFCQISEGAGRDEKLTERGRRQTKDFEEKKFSGTQSGLNRRLILRMTHHAIVQNNSFAF
jgi:hypothetical protein